MLWKKELPTDSRYLYLLSLTASADSSAERAAAWHSELMANSITINDQAAHALAELPRPDELTRMA
jgi:hypothetical protein